MKKEKHHLERHIGNYNGDYYHCMDCDCALIINKIIDYGIANKKFCHCSVRPVKRK